MAESQKRAWAEVDVDALRHNFSLVKQRLAAGVRLCCVIKANAYGHGAAFLSRFYETMGADFLAVSNIEEALQVRREGVTLPVLILGYTPPACAPAIIAADLSQCVYSLPYAEALSSAALAAKGRVRAHFKLDTGMGRLGFVCREETPLPAGLSTAATLAGLLPEGIFTHLARADEGEAGKAYTLRQLSLFKTAVSAMRRAGFSFPYCHAANSAAILAYPNEALGGLLTMARAGIVLYGLKPDPAMAFSSLAPALTFKTVVDFVKELRPGDALSYGSTFVADRSMRVATLPVGYADGLFRALSSSGYAVTVGGRRAPLVGRVCMDQCLADVTDLPPLALGEEVVLYGGAGESAEATAAKAGTIAYELVSALSSRVPRVYREGGRILAVSDALLAPKG